ncbi:peptidase MA family metallohydrolase [Chloroflexota bacterium]
MRFIYKLLAAGFTLVLVLGVCGCESEPLPVPPAPVAAEDQAETPRDDTETPEPESQAVEPGESGITIESDTAANHFPDKITFSLQGGSDTEIETIVLEYGSDKRSLVASVNSIEPEFQKGLDIDVSWDWDMKKSGSLPPGATVWWRWKLTDNRGNTTTTDRQTLPYEDTRFQWQTTRVSGMDIYWNGQSQTLRSELTAELETRLARIQLDVTIPQERAIKVFVYRDSEQLKGAMLHEQEWVGAVAFTNYNIILTAVNEDSLDWAKGALPHEVTHLLVREYIFGPFGDIPAWLSEGLSVYSEGDLSEDRDQSLNKAARENGLISVQSLSGSFPVDPAQAHLAYAQSGSIVNFLIKEYGWQDMRRLLQVFKEGSTYDKALLEVYALDVEGIEAEWLKYLDADL